MTPRERLEHSIAVAEGMNINSGGADQFAEKTGASLTFSNGTYVLQHCGIRVSSTWKSPSMVVSWHEKAERKLANNYLPYGKQVEG